MAHILPPSRFLISFSTRSTLCQPCLFQLTRPAARTFILETFNRWRRGESDDEDTRRQIRLAEIEEELRKLEAQEPELSQLSRSWDNLPWVGSKKYIWNNAPLQLPENATKRWPRREPLPHLQREMEPSVLLSFIDAIIIHYAKPSAEAEISPSDLAIYTDAFSQSATINNVDNHPSITFSSRGAFNTCLYYLEALGLSKEESKTLVDQHIITYLPTTPASNDGTQPSWHAVSLPEPLLRWLLLTRIFKHTGHRLPDHALRNCTTAGDMFQLLITKPAEKTKLAERILDDGLLHLPNVSMSTKRVSKIHNDIAVGRWKLTRQQLKKHGLPELWKLPNLSARRSKPFVHPAKLAGQATLPAPGP